MDYRTALLDRNRTFGELAAQADPAAPVPTCPGWSVTQLVRHVGRGDRWAGQIVADKSAVPVDPRTVAGGKPADGADIGQWLHEGAVVLLDAVGVTGAQTPVWTFIGPRPASWWIRRRLHEVSVHTADLALAVGADVELAADLAADGISEWLDVVLTMATQAQGPGPLEPGQSLHLHADDPGLGQAGEWIVRADLDGVGWTSEHEKASTALHGRAVGLLLALSGRQTAEAAGVTVFGDTGVWDRWLERTQF